MNVFSSLDNAMFVRKLVLFLETLLELLQLLRI